MNDLKDKIVDKIISLLSPLREEYTLEINSITNDLINDKYDSLIEFVYSHFDNINVSDEIKIFIQDLVNNGLIDNSFLEKIKTKKNYEYIPFTYYNNIISTGNKPLNVKIEVFGEIISNTKEPIINIINQEPMEFNLPDEEINNEQELPDNSSINNQIDIDTVRKKILDAQLNYINNASNFIKSLEEMDEKDIYQSLIDLNDIRFIQHSLSKLSKGTLDRLNTYVIDNKHGSIDMFIIEVIKKYLHQKML